MSSTGQAPPQGAGTGAAGGAGAPTLTSDEVWRALERASFAVISHVTPSGDARCSGVVYIADGHRLYVAVGANSWKARHIAAHPRVAVTVPVRRGGLLALLYPIPPATITFQADALVYPASARDEHPLPARLARLLPEEGRADNAIIEIHPVGTFLAYGIGVSVLQMRRPSVASRRAPVG